MTTKTARAHFDSCGLDMTRPGADDQCRDAHCPCWCHEPERYPTRACPDCGTVYEQRYEHALGSCEPCNAAQAAVRTGRATLTSWLLAQVPAEPQPEPPAPKQAKLRQHPDGRIEALSSDGHTIYRVTVEGAGSCTCPAGQRGALCYHLRTARGRYGLPVNVIPFPARRATKDLLYA